MRRFWMISKHPWTQATCNAVDDDVPHLVSGSAPWSNRSLTRFGRLDNVARNKGVIPLPLFLRLFDNEGWDIKWCSKSSSVELSLKRYPSFPVKLISTRHTFGCIEDVWDSLWLRGRPLVVLPIGYDLFVFKSLWEVVFSIVFRSPLPISLFSVVIERIRSDDMISLVAFFSVLPTPLSVCAGIFSNISTWPIWHWLLLNNDTTGQAGRWQEQQIEKTYREYVHCN